MSVTRFPNGVTNVSQQHIMGDLIIPDPSSLNMWYLDFITWYPFGIAAAFADGSAFLAIPWGDSMVGASDILPTTASGQGRRGGRVSFITGGNDNDAAILHTFMTPFVVGSRDLWFETTIRARTDVLTQTIHTGIAFEPTLTDNPANGLYFIKRDGTQDIELVMRSGDSDTFNVIAGEMDTSASPPGNSDVVLGFHWDASKRTLRWSVNTQFGATGGISEQISQGQPVGQMYGFMRVVTNSASAVTVDWDDIFVAQSRNPNGGYT